MTDVGEVTGAGSVRDQRRAAAALVAAGLRAGDRLLVSAAASPALLAVVLGALRTGVVPVVLDPALPAAERAALAEDADPSLDVGAHPERLLGGTDEAELADVPLARPMHYTSGTTGRRKGVWSGVLAEQDASALAAEEIELWGFGPGDRHLVLSPLHHSAPLRFAVHTLLAGGTVLLPGPFAVGRAAEAVSTLRPTTTFCVPTHLRRLLGHGEVDWSSFRRLVHAGAPCPAPLKRSVLDALPDGSVWEFYGSTEAQFTVCSPEDWLARPGSVGRARPGRRLETDDRGQLWCAVPPWARFEYWRSPEKTAAAWRGDLVTVGDLGRVDDDGVVWLDGRREDLVISGGVNVYPAEVEAVLDAHPGVVESAVFGVPDEDWGERVVAAYVGTARPAELSAWARERLAPAKRPKALHPLGELPRTSTGKVRRLDLPQVLERGSPCPPPLAGSRRDAARGPIA
ncbi:class I adenylate-forming enzyme family protein [Blastococcus deserti]|uniref:Class I adenylate-forming enzyme family protein n=1 Tax=Blastococcus deserti TaxID=2259033 RepID=A0ABW4X652_9ACTN